MSNRYYSKLWSNAQNDLLDILELEPSKDAPKFPERNSQVAFQTVAILFVKYISVLHKFDEIYDQMLHPQKRRIVHKILEGIMGRIIELKHEMVNLDCLDFHFFDDILTDMKLSPENIEIPVPKYFVQEQAMILKRRGDSLKRLLDRMYPMYEEAKMNLEKAILLIQNHERAKQSRVRVKYLMSLQAQDSKSRRRLSKAAFLSLNQELAAIRIQKFWRMYVMRQKIIKLRENELIFLGMNPDFQEKYTNDLKESEALIEKRRQLRDQYEEDYQKDLELTKDRIKTDKEIIIQDILQNEIRQWFVECRNATGRFPDFPEASDEGIESLYIMKDPEQLRQELIQQQEEAEREKRDDKSKKDKDKKKEKPKEKKKKEEEENLGWQMAPSNFLPAINQENDNYIEIWKFRDDSKNFSQKQDILLMREEKNREAEQEIRKDVEKLMQQELFRLRMVIDKDTTKAKAKKKKKKAKAKGKKKKEKDLTPDRTLDSLYEELVIEGILIKADPVKITDYIGDMNYVASSLLQGEIQPMPCIADIRQIITAYAILPLGSQIVHERAPLIKSILLAGPRGIGKKMLVHAVCHETGANLFDLTHTNLIGKYPGKKGLEMLMHMVLKVGRILEPSVVLINDAEMMFQKKIPKAELKNEPRRLKSILPKFIKKLTAQNRILVIGISNNPYDATLKPLTKCYQKIILIPRPDYGSRKLMWKNMITKAGGIITRKLDLGSIAKASDGFVGQNFLDSVSTVMTQKRLVTQKTNALTAHEFISPLVSMKPVLKDEEETFKKWYAKTPLGKKRMALFSTDDENDKKKKGGKKDKKKKK